MESIQTNLKHQARAAFELRKRQERERMNIPAPERSQEISEARDEFTKFVMYTKPDYIMNWHHKYLCSKLQDFAEARIKRLMVFMPPQHGKSELVSRRLPAFMLGRKPNLKVIGASYSDTLASSFNRDVQRIIDDMLYHDLFPDTLLNQSNVRTLGKGNNYLRNADIFEIVDYKGFYKSVGVGGGLTGTPADIAIIDDPIKDALEAQSPTYRERMWDWYTNVLETRLHNNSQILITLTRWHENDLAGRILADNIDEFQIISFPGLKEDNSNPDDPREIGEALWEEMHSRDKLEKVKKKNYRTFVSLYQQRPAPEEGNIIKKDWFKYFYASDLPEGLPVHFYSDTAYGKENSDHSATMAYSIHDSCLYIRDMWVVNLPFPDFIRGYKDFIERSGYSHKSACRFEPKATGISAVQSLRLQEVKGHKINVLEGKPPKDGKEARVKGVSNIVETGRVLLLKDSAWIEAFLTECGTFPNGEFDDQPDVLGAVLDQELNLEETVFSIRRQLKKNG